MAYNSELNSLNAQHISANLAAYEAARTGFFSFIVEDIDGIIKSTYTGDAENAQESDKIRNAQEILKLNVVRSSVPHFGLQTLSYTRGNEKITYAGTPTWNAGSITVDDIVGLDTKSILMAWQGLAYNVHTRRGGKMSEYKKDCTLIEYTQAGEQIRSWKLYGCWISDISENDFDKENDGKRQLGATIQYDRAIMELNEEEAE